MKTNGRLLLIILALLCLLPSCRASSVTDLPVISQFLAPSPTPTPLPTATSPPPTATATPTSTSTATPSPTATPTSTPPPTATLAPAYPSVANLEIARGDPGRPWMALTFDAGASLVPLPSMLETLRQKDVRCTFFLTGDTVRRPEAPELLQQMVAEGHELANHSDTHPQFTDLTDEEIARELARLEEAVVALTGVSTKPYFRPPSGNRDARTLQVVQQNGYINIYWTYQVWDWTGDRTADEIYQYSVDGACNGAIVVMHVGAQETADALPAIIDELQGRGYRLVTLSELLGS